MAVNGHEVQIKAIRSDGAEWYYNSDDWGITGLTGLDSSPVEIFRSNKGFGDGSFITGKRKGEREIQIVAKCKTLHNNAETRARCIAFHNSNYTYQLVITYLGKTSRENGNTDYIKYAYDWSNAARRVVIYTPVAKYEELQTLKDPKDPTNTAQSNHKYYWDTDCRIKHPQTSMFLHVQTALVSNKYFSSPAINGWPKLYPEAYVNPQIENIDSKGVDAICRESDAAAKLELLNHMPETNVEIGALQVDGCKYLEHYDLGDTVTVRIDAIKEQFTQRIIEVNEVWENNQETPTLVFGNKRRVKYRSPQDTKYAKNRTR